ncbi:hypothetical protein [Timonella sp. A28]|uniref:hypothetical protein n=1 Tax=Timonella sp. A28 TaxID=3442640 RepID=UPI003EBCCE1F
MNDFKSLKEFRNDIPEPALEDLAPAFAQLKSVMVAEQRQQNASSPHTKALKKRKRLTFMLIGWSTVTTACVVAITIFAMNVFNTPHSASAVTLLHQAANNTVKYSDYEVGEGQYLHIRAEQRGIFENTYDVPPPEVADLFGQPYHQTVDEYIPSNFEDVWVRKTSPRIVGNFEESPSDFISAPNGAYYAEDDNAYVEGVIPENFSLTMLNKMPTSSGEAAYAYVDSLYSGGSNSRDEDNFVRILELLDIGVANATQRAAIYQALALIPGVVNTKDILLDDGRSVVGFSRSEKTRDDWTTEVLISPSTGEYVGIRTFKGDGTFESEEIITYDVVDSAPTR